MTLSLSFPLSVQYLSVNQRKGREIDEEEQRLGGGDGLLRLSVSARIFLLSDTQPQEFGFFFFFGLWKSGLHNPVLSN